MSDPPTGPLAGIRVIDVGTRISAPFCAGLLGELGLEDQGLWPEAFGLQSII